MTWLEVVYVYLMGLGMAVAALGIPVLMRHPKKRRK